MNLNQLNQSGFGHSFGADVQVIGGILRERVRLIVLCILAALLGGYVYLSYSPRVYRAEAVLQVEQEEQNLLGFDGYKPEDLRSQEVLRTIEQNLKSPGLLLRVIQENHLATDPSFLPHIKRPVSDDVLQRAFAKQISVRLRTGSRLIDVSVDDGKPAMARQLAQLLIAEFIQMGFRSRVDSSQMAHDYMVKEAERLRVRLIKSEEALQEYREKTQTVSLEDKQNIVVEKLKEMNQRVTEAKAARLKLEADNAQISQMSRERPDQLLAIASVANSAPVLELQRAIHEREGQLANLRQRYKPLHPKYISALSELQETKQGLDAAIQKGVDSVSQTYVAALATEAGLEKALREQEQVALALNKKSITYTGLLSEAESDRALYNSILKRLKENDISKDISKNSVRVVSEPIASEIPVKPSKQRIMLLSLFGGVGLGCGLSLLGRALDSSLRSVEEAEAALGLHALAAIPNTGQIRSLSEGARIINDPSSHAAEAFRTLRTSLSLLSTCEGGCSILFTSAVPSEGKTFCAINTAIAYAQQGLRTLLIDADLRLPTVGGVFFGEKSFTGVTDVLTKKAELEAAIRPSGLENLFILGAGSRMPRVAELLARNGFQELLRSVCAKFDRVVIDSAPVHAVSDTLLLVTHVQAVCLVVRAERTPLQSVLAAVRKLKKANTVPDGFVLNGISAFRMETYASYYRAEGEALLENAAVSRLDTPSAAAKLRDRSDETPKGE